jgi:rhodanese-related sulfurtransferase
MKKYMLSLLFISMVLSNCNGQTSKNTTVSSASPIVFQKKLKETKKAQLIDVRTPEEYTAEHIEDAINFNWYDVDFATKISILDKKKPVFVYCKAGGRSSKAAAKLAEMGFTKIYDLEGGFTNWIANYLPVKK